jgi:hypothetical protein
MSNTGETSIAYIYVDKVTDVPDDPTKGAITGGIVQNPGSGYQLYDALTIGGGDGNAILIVNGLYDASPITAISIIGGGSGYTGDRVSRFCIMTDTNDALVDVLTVDENGAILTYEIVGAGTNYFVNAGPVATSTNVGGGYGYGGGSGATVSIDSVNTITAGIAQYTLDFPRGSGYSEGEVALSGGHGEGATFSINGVTAVTGAIQTNAIEFLYNENGAGNDYEEGDIIYINGGNGKATITVYGVYAGNYIYEVTLLNGGSGYTPTYPDPYPLSPSRIALLSGSNDALIDVLTVDENGAILTYAIAGGGSTYSVDAGPIATSTSGDYGGSGTGSGATFSIDSITSFTGRIGSFILQNNDGDEYPVGIPLPVTGGHGSGLQILVMAVTPIYGIKEYHLDTDRGIGTYYHAGKTYGINWHNGDSEGRDASFIVDSVINTRDKGPGGPVLVLHAVDGSGDGYTVALNVPFYDSNENADPGNHGFADITAINTI